ncbi:hypothetical protein [Desulfosarcina cetonica]|uniref:hypothetical protein n=1 Tax=Desulfosarcina cetonica TaxID=90730 RepID=UPI0006D1E631|nr:hypothetical protein [Desulfosarcina cetonica]
MKKIEFIIVGLFLSLLIVSPINAAYVDLTIDGISLSNDGDVYYPSSGEVTIDVWIVGEGETLSNYSFDILYDMSEGISFLSGEEIEPSGG